MRQPAARDRGDRGREYRGVSVFVQNTQPYTYFRRRPVTLSDGATLASGDLSGAVLDARQRARRPDDRLPAAVPARAGRRPPARPRVRRARRAARALRRRPARPGPGRRRLHRHARRGRLQRPPRRAHGRRLGGRGELVAAPAQPARQRPGEQRARRLAGELAELAVQVRLVVVAAGLRDLRERRRRPPGRARPRARSAAAGRGTSARRRRPRGSGRPGGAGSSPAPPRAPRRSASRARRRARATRRARRGCGAGAAASRRASSASSRAKRDSQSGASASSSTRVPRPRRSSSGTVALCSSCSGTPSSRRAPGGESFSSIPRWTPSCSVSAGRSQSAATNELWRAPSTCMAGPSERITVTDAWGSSERRSGASVRST